MQYTPKFATLTMRIAPPVNRPKEIHYSFLLLINLLKKVVSLGIVFHNEGYQDVFIR
ncbi:hypothetical protein VCRA2117O328_10261 [Vibrio crassostreae]|nr:hypothetical protein VCRA2117O328_10261 [Vibrio crassostreae]